MTIHWIDPAQWQATRHKMNDEPIIVIQPGLWENDTGPKDWYAICDVDGIFAYSDNAEEADQIANWFQRRAVHETMKEHLARNKL